MIEVADSTSTIPESVSVEIRQQRSKARYELDRRANADFRVE